MYYDIELESNRDKKIGKMGIGSNRSLILNIKKNEVLYNIFD